MPIDWGYVRDDLRASWYTGVMRSRPRRRPSRIRVGWIVGSLGEEAMLRKRSS